MTLILIIVVLVLALIGCAALNRSNNKLDAKINRFDAGYPSFHVRFKGIQEDSLLYSYGLRSGQFGVVVKHTKGMYVKVTTSTQQTKYLLISTKQYFLLNNQA
jgi:hypothetical protein